MTENDKTIKMRESENEEYLCKIFAMLKKVEKFSGLKEKTELNNTELRLISEIIFARQEGERLISTQLAKRLNVTRSAVSQIVNNLENRGVIQRVDAEDDKKIAYVELTESAMEIYQNAKKAGVDFVGEFLKEFGKDNLDLLLNLMDSFWETACAVSKKNLNK